MKNYSDITENLDITTKQYVDSGFMPKTGGIFTGDVTITPGHLKTDLIKSADNSKRIAEFTAAGLEIGGSGTPLRFYSSTRPVVANQNNELAYTSDIPAAVTESTVSSWGFTKNTGTVTSVAVKMNGETKGTVTSSGTIDLGTVLTNDGGTINKSKTVKMDASANSDGANLKWGTVNSKNPYIGYASDQVDGTFVVGSLLGTNYASGLAIGGGSGNLLWKGTKVATTSDITAHSNIVATQTILGHIKMYVEGDTLYLNT